MDRVPGDRVPRAGFHHGGHVQRGWLGAGFPPEAPQHDLTDLARDLPADESNFFAYGRVHDISNSLKLDRTEIFRSIEIEERHFVANAELGVKPLLAGYDIEEVPISWINRTIEMGSFSFRIVKVALNYIGTLARALTLAWRGARRLDTTSGGVQFPR